ncbi:50S ribosomal protein L4 [Candidatus Microgenomates bacterium]|nr:MAG: 50S ribosomal protein L4 [Candidatus Microgenomates bacterium]
MSKINLYSLKSDKASQISVPKEIAGEENTALLAQAIHVYRDRQHAGVSRVKTRGEIARTTKKWFKQKGTGNARHGARSAPIFVGGGVAHGPKGIKRVLTLSKKMKKKALSAALYYKLGKGQVSAFNSTGALTKTKEAKELVENIVKGELGGRKKYKLTFVLSPETMKSSRLFRNIENVNIAVYGNLNSYGAYFGGNLIFDMANFEEKNTKKAIGK